MCSIQHVNLSLQSLPKCNASRSWGKVWSLPPKTAGASQDDSWGKFSIFTLLLMVMINNPPPAPVVQHQRTSEAVRHFDRKSFMVVGTHHCPFQSRRLYLESENRRIDRWSGSCRTFDTLTGELFLFASLLLKFIEVCINAVLLNFQIATKAGNIEMVKALLPVSTIERLDNNSNSVFHYAASTTKEMINVSGRIYVSNYHI